MRSLGLVSIVAIVLPLSGCVALPLMAPAAVSAGGDLVKAGTARVGGTTYRTFSLPLSEVYQATRKALDGLGFPPPEEESVDERVTLRSRAIERTVRIELHPITGAMTQMRVTVRKESFAQDLATASELVAQTERVLEPPAAEPRQTQRKARAAR